MKKILIALITLIALSVMLVAADNVPARKNMQNNDNSMMKPGNGMGPRAERMKDIFEELDLSKDQLKKMEALKVDHEKLMNSKQAEVENLIIDKHQAMKTEKFEQVKTINKAIADLNLFMDNARVDHHAAILKILTPEQKEKFAELMPMGPKMGLGRGGNCGMHMGNHPGMGRGMGNGMGNGMGKHMNRENDCRGNCD